MDRFWSRLMIIMWLTAAQNQLKYLKFQTLYEWCKCENAFKIKKSWNSTELQTQSGSIIDKSQSVLPQMSTLHKQFVSSVNSILEKCHQLAWPWPDLDGLDALDLVQQSHVGQAHLVCLVMEHVPQVRQQGCHQGVWQVVVKEICQSLYHKQSM